MSNQRAVNFNVSPKERKLIRQIAARFQAQDAPDMSLIMDITAVHTNGCPLRLTDLLEADVLDFVHDIIGICRHLNRQTGKLEGNFQPRFAV